MILLLCLGIAFLAILRVLLSNAKTNRLYKKFPGPKTYPIIGSMLEFDYPKVEVTETFKKLSFQYGSVYYMKMGMDPIVCIRDPSDIECILGSTKEINKPDSIYWSIKVWLGDGLLTSRGNLWRRNRKIITPAFHFEILKQFVSTFTSNGQILVDCFSKISGQEVDVTPFIKRCTLDIIAETAMGLQINAQLEDSEYVQSLHEFLEIVAHRGFIWWQKTFLFDLFPVGKRWKRLIHYLNSVTESVLRERQEEKLQYAIEKCCGLGEKKETNKKKAFLDLLLEYKLNNENVLTDQEICLEVNTFMFEGSDTTSSTISFCLYCLSQNQDVQEKVYEEVTSIIGDGDCVPTYEDIQKMNYLGKVVKETLRRYPTVQFIGRTIENDMELKSGYVVPANSAVLVLIEAMNHDPMLYPDPYKFDPERFSENLKHPYSYIPFSAGSRNCIGQKYALLEIKAVMSMVVRKYRFLPSNIPITPWFIIVQQSKTGIHMKIEPRNVA